MMSNFNSMMALGIFIGVCVGVFLLAVCNRNGRIKTEYDERQQVIRGVGYKYAAYATWGLLGVYLFLEVFDVLPMENACAIFIIIMIGLLVQISYSIWKDAYWGNNNNVKKYIILFVVITAINGASAFVRYRSGEMIVDGKLAFSGSINLICTVMFLLIGLQLIAKTFIAGDAEE